MRSSLNRFLIGSNQTGFSEYQSFENATTGISLEGNVAAYNLPSSHLLSDTKSSEDFAIPYDSLVNKIEATFRVFVPENKDVTLIQQAQFSPSPFTQKYTKGVPYVGGSENSAKKYKLLDEVFGRETLFLGTPEKLNYAEQFYDGRRGNVMKGGGQISNHNNQIDITIDAEAFLTDALLFKGDGNLYPRGFSKFHEPNELGDYESTCTVTTTINGRVFERKPLDVQLGDRHHSPRLTVKAYEQSHEGRLLLMEDTVLTNQMLPLKAGHNEVSISTSCSGETYTRGNLINDYMTRVKSLSFALSDFETQAPAQLVNYAPKDVSGAASIEGTLSSSPSTLMKFNGLNKESKRSMVDAAKLITSEDLLVETKSNKTKKSQGEILLLDEKLSHYKGTFYPKQTGQYEFVVMTKSNLFETRELLWADPTAPLLRPSLESKIYADLPNNVSFLNIDDYMHDKVATGWVQPDYKLIINTDMVLENRLRVDGLDSTPTTWNVGFYNVTKDTSKKGIPFVFSALGNKGQKHMSLPKQKDKYTNKSVHYQYLVTKAFWNEDKKGKERLREYTERSDDEVFSQQIALYVKEPRNSSEK